MGAARDSYEVALKYASERVQFKKPIASFQLTQQKLVDMVLQIQKGVLVALHIGRMKDAGGLCPEQISFGKLNNVREAIAIAREARTILGGNGIALDYSPLRHANNLESVRTYEGSDEVHTLITCQGVARGLRDEVSCPAGGASTIGNDRALFGVADSKWTRCLRPEQLAWRVGYHVAPSTSGPGNGARCLENIRPQLIMGGQSRRFEPSPRLERGCSTLELIGCALMGRRSLRCAPAPGSDDGLSCFLTPPVC